eukprot:6828888-Alexandrium_andersonii.AAC.1
MGGPPGIGIPRSARREVASSDHAPFRRDRLGSLRVGPAQSGGDLGVRVIGSHRPELHRA